MGVWAEMEWRWSHPQPHGNNLSDMVYRDGLHVHVTDHGGIYASTNRLVWQRRESGTLKDLRAAVFSQGRFVTTGEEGTALWSDDLTRFEPGTLSPTTADWLEGLAASDGLVVAVGDNGAVYRSSDGKGWERVAAGFTTEWLRGVAHGAGLFVMVGENGWVASSPDGAAWTRRNSGVTVNLNRVAFGDGRFLVVGDNGVIMTSANGTLWTREADTVSSNALNTAVLSPGERLVAGDASMSLRRPPFVWQDQLSDTISPSPAPAWEYAASIWDGTRYVIGGRTGVLVESFRTNAPPFQDATFWFRLDDTPRNWLWDIAWVEGTYLAVGDRSTILSSATGVEWSLESVPEVAAEQVLYGVGGSPDFGLAVGEDGLILRSPAGWTNIVTSHEVVVGTRTNIVWMTNHVSLMGLIWEVVEPRPTTNTLQGVAWDGTRHVLVGRGGTVLTGTNTTKWTVTQTSGREYLSSVVSFGSGWVASGAEGALYTSPDATVWTRRDSGTTAWVYRLHGVGTGLMAVGAGGLILTSADGVKWVSQTSGTSSFLTGVRSIGDAVYVCGGQGTVLRSTNQVDWTVVPSLTGKALNGLADRASQLVVVGAEGVILRAIAEQGAKSVNIQGYRYFREPAPPVEVLTFQGVPEQRFRWEGGAILGVWELEANLELDANGTAVVGREADRPIRFHRAATP